MNTRRRNKILKDIAHQEAARLIQSGCYAKVHKMVDENCYVVTANNSGGELTIFIDRLEGPYHTCLTKKENQYVF
ncbi:hypothetical protein [Rummeliibacillus stabekisii]|uniref:PepSY domain-containing protein n=1 Tax=Rummeliibacillus stabekisii TaxID=241244 RepID=A0A143H9N3_9BACL|nr:hypothetical protein [Rummeliibacillus stabekisii]AMW98428.1 hypothetical protein ATY39_02665 [Rummeliibacillus stabekisii]